MPRSAFTCKNCFIGCRSDRASRSLRPKVKLLPVSVHRIQRSSPPDPIGCDTVVVGFIAELRQVVYQEPCLYSCPRSHKKPRPVSKSVAQAQARRDTRRGSLEELSKYYLRDGVENWEVAKLLSKGKGLFDALATFNLPTCFSVVEDLEAHPTPNNSAPGTSTSPTIAVYRITPAGWIPMHIRTRHLFDDR